MLLYYYVSFGGIKMERVELLEEFFRENNIECSEEFLKMFRQNFDLFKRVQKALEEQKVIIEGILEETEGSILCGMRDWLGL